MSPSELGEQSGGISNERRQDVFVRDRWTNTTERVSVGPGGLQGNGGSLTGVISANGRYVVFFSAANNLLGPGIDTNGVQDVFIHDRQTGITERASVGPGGLQADAQSLGYSVSADGRFVGFSTQATNLLGVGVDTSNNSDVFVRDRLTGITERVSVGPGGVESDGYAASGGTVLSADGGVIAFYSLATNLVSPPVMSGNYNAYVRVADPTDPLGIDAKLFQDGRLDDTVLEAVNATSGAITTLCPADEVAVAAGQGPSSAPEAARLCVDGPTPDAPCTSNAQWGRHVQPGDARLPEGIAQRRRGHQRPRRAALAGERSVENLHCAASAVALSPTWVARWCRSGRGKRTERRHEPERRRRRFPPCRRRASHDLRQLAEHRAACRHPGGVGRRCGVHHARGRAGER
jgi:hypothetical protein